MRFLFLLTQSLESPSGGGRFLPLAQALVRKGHSVTMILLHHDFASCMAREQQVGGVRVRYVGQMHVRKQGSRKSYYPAWQLPLVAARAAAQLTAAAQRERADVIVLCKSQPMNSVAAWVVRLLRRTPIVLESDDWEAMNNRFQAPYQQRVVAWVERQAARHAIGISAGTRFIKRQYEALGVPAERIQVTPNSADPMRMQWAGSADLTPWQEAQRARLALPPDKPLIVYVGSLSLHNHALELLLDGFAHIAPRVPDAQLLLVGGGEDWETLHQHVEALGIKEQVHFAGRVPADDAPRYYTLGRFSVAPMRDTETARSSLAIKLAESIYAGVPVLTTDVGDYAERVGPAGLAVKPTAEAYGEAMLRLLRDDHELMALREAAQAHRAEYSWDTTIESFLRLFD